MSIPTIIGEGTYGCVHKPSLKCKNKPKIKDESIVSKLMEDYHANEELTEFKLIESADKKQSFHLGKPTSCKVEDNIQNNVAINNCSGFDKKSIHNYSLLLLKYGGTDLYQFGKYVNELSHNDANTRMIEHFWLEVSRILFGVKILSDNGMIHHDLKHKNIVYNKEKKRINFIDFGLMTTKSKIIKAANDSNYDFSRNHWSFPVEMKLYNKNTFNKITKLSGKKKKNVVSNAAHDINEYHNHIFQCIFDSKETHNYSHSVNILFNNYYQMISNLSPNQYGVFIDKSIDTIDTYGTATGLLYVLKKCKKHISSDFYKDLKNIFSNMVNFNVFNRDSPAVIVNKYENILLKHDLLKKYNMKFVDHILTPGSQPTLINNSIALIPQQNFLDSIIIQCPEGKELNPKTNRCINTCKDGFERNDKFLCRKKKSQKNKSQKNKSQKKCPTGKELNPNTNQCNKTCKHGYKRDNKFKCVREECPTGTELNTKTNRCNKTCKTGYKRDNKFNCVKEN
jgi:serine/threonine protein kinase